jgi:peptide methionine sulfoxide reductase msrA/msrB
VTRPSLLALLVSTSTALACTSPQREAPARTAASAPAPAAPRELAGSQPKIPHEEGVAYFAGGCFWGVEHYLEQLEGVERVESGYMGGSVDAPSYEQVVEHGTGHYESVRVRFDPAKIDFAQVAKRFFEIHDPTQADGQGPDIGPQYRSAVFYTNEEQLQATRTLVEQLEARGYDVVTELLPATTFWPAEDYHQDYYEKTGKTPYCHTRVPRFGD